MLIKKPDHRGTVTGPVSTCQEASTYGNLLNSDVERDESTITYIHRLFKKYSYPLYIAAKWRLIVRPMQKAIEVFCYTSDNLTKIDPQICICTCSHSVGWFVSKVAWVATRRNVMSTSEVIPCIWEKVELCLKNEAAK